MSLEICILDIPMPPQELLDLKAELIYGFKITEENHKKLREHNRQYSDVYTLRNAVVALSIDLGVPTAFSLIARRLGKRTQEGDREVVVNLGSYSWHRGQGHLMCFCVYDILPQLMEKLGVTEQPQWYPLGR